MPLLEINESKKMTATISLESTTAKLVDAYAAYTKTNADAVINAALEYVFEKDRDFQKYRESHASTSFPGSLRVKKPGAKERLS